MKITPEETAQFMHSSNISYSFKRKMSTMLGKMFNFNIFSTKKKQREFEKDRKALVESDKLKHGTMLMMETAHYEYSTLCSCVRVSELFALAK